MGRMLRRPMGRGGGLVWVEVGGDKGGRRGRKEREGGRRGEERDEGKERDEGQEERRGDKEGSEKGGGGYKACKEKSAVTSADRERK
jgi:hypothetical protein